MSQPAATIAYLAACRGLLPLRPSRLVGFFPFNRAIGGALPFYTGVLSEYDSVGNDQRRGLPKHLLDNALHEMVDPRRRCSVRGLGPVVLLLKERNVLSP